MIVDVNVYLGRWPFRRLRGDDTATLVAILQKHNVTQAWAGSFEGLLHRDVRGVNDRLVRECRQHGQDLLLPFGTINPMLPDWEDELHRCHQVQRMPGIRLHPNYHGYRLDEAAVATLLRRAAAANLIVQIVLKMEDERTQHPLCRVPAVDPAPLLALLPEVKGLRLILLNALVAPARAEALRQLIQAGQVYVDLAMLEGVGGVGTVLQTFPVERLLFGSHFPLFYYESALNKLHESALRPEQERAVRGQNARLLLPRQGP